MLEVRPERPGEAAALERVHALAFGRDSEARLVRRLRAEGFNIVSMIAAEANAIVGHALFSRLLAEGNEHINAVALAPVAVIPERQKQGIGSKLILAGLDACRSSAVDVALVLGDPEYYERFGFSSELGERFRAPWSGPEFLAIELRAGVLGDRTFDVIYPAAFQEV